MMGIAARMGIRITMAVNVTSVPRGIMYITRAPVTAARKGTRIIMMVNVTSVPRGIICTIQVPVTALRRGIPLPTA